MLRRRNLLIGLGLSAAAGLASLAYSTSLEREVLADAVVTTQAIPAGRRLDEAMLQFRQLPRRAVLPGVCTRLSEAVGRITLSPLVAGEQVIATRLARPREPGEGVVGLVPGERGVVVAVESETLQALRLGEYVDVVAVDPAGEVGQPTRLVAGARVIRVFPRTEEGRDPRVLLAVTPSQAQALAAAEEVGRLRLVLRAGPDARTRPASRPLPATRPGAARPSPKPAAPPKPPGAAPGRGDGESLLEGRAAGAPQPRTEVEVIRGVVSER
ncbi:MAG: Flp pilus assembly protein CpaB [Chitinophagales bacterium]